MSNEMAEEIRQVRIRHEGQCPEVKGHTADVVFGAVMITAAVTFFLTGIVMGLVNPDYRKEAVERGYAAYDAKTGVWRWK